MSTACRTCGSTEAERYGTRINGRATIELRCVECGQPVGAPPTEQTHTVATDGGTTVDQPTDSEPATDHPNRRPDFDADLGIPPVFKTARDAGMWVRIDSRSGTEIIRHTDDGWQARHRRADGELVDKVFDLEPFALQQRYRNHGDSIAVIAPRQTTIEFDSEEAE